MANIESASDGALIVYTDHEKLRGQRCEIWINRHVSEMVQERVIKQTVFDSEVWAAVFPYLPAGTHTLPIWTGSFTDFTIYADRLTELYEADYRDWEW